LPAPATPGKRQVYYQPLFTGSVLKALPSLPSCLPSQSPPPTRRHDEHVVRGHPQRLRQRGGARNGVLIALGARSGIGLARIGQHLASAGNSGSKRCEASKGTGSAWRKCAAHRPFLPSPLSPDTLSCLPLPAAVLTALTAFFLASTSLQYVTGAAHITFFVNTPAAAAGASATTSDKSAFTPAARRPAYTPGRVRVGMCAVRGDICVQRTRPPSSEGRPAGKRCSKPLESAGGWGNAAERGLVTHLPAAASCPKCKSPRNTRRWLIWMHSLLPARTRGLEALGGADAAGHLLPGAVRDEVRHRGDLERLGRSRHLGTHDEARLAGGGAGLDTRRRWCEGVRLDGRCAPQRLGRRCACCRPRPYRGCASMTVAARS
jgi:hypothetical protein